MIGSYTRVVYSLYLSETRKAVVFDARTVDGSPCYGPQSMRPSGHSKIREQFRRFQGMRRDAEDPKSR